jgi:hypothetical protein
MALVAKAVMATGLPLRLRLARLPVSSAPVAVAVGLTARLPHRELRLLAFRDVPFGPWQRRTNEPAVNRAVVLTLTGRIGAIDGCRIDGCRIGGCRKVHVGVCVAVG